MLEELAQRVTGHTPNRGKPEYWDGGVRWLSLADSDRLDRGSISRTAKEISREGIRHSSARLLPAGTVVMLRDAGVGKSAILGTEMAVSQHFVGWVCGDGLDNQYLYYWLLGNREYFERMAFGSTIVTIGMPFFRRLSLGLPPLPEQRKIAMIFSTWDRAIEQTEMLIEAKERLKKGLMQQLLTGRLRFPQFAGTPWQTCRLGELFERVTRTVGDTPDVEPLSITARVGFVRQRDKFSKVIAGKQITDYILLYRGEFAYNKGNSDAYPQGCVHRLAECERGAVPHVYFCFRANSPDVDPDFYVFYFSHGMLNPQLSRLINSGVRNDGLLNLPADAFFRMTVLVPPLPEQKRIARVLNACRSDISLLRRNLDALRQQKRGLMQKLLTGEVRVDAPQPNRRTDEQT
jgi:type I restriction enzyme S subunit